MNSKDVLHNLMTDSSFQILFLVFETYLHRTVVSEPKKKTRFDFNHYCGLLEHNFIVSFQTTTSVFSATKSFLFEMKKHACPVSRRVA